MEISRETIEELLQANEEMLWKMRENLSMRIRQQWMEEFLKACIKTYKDILNDKND